MERLEVQSFGPIGKVSIEFGDLTLLIGPQASGKSIFLQLLKLLVDKIISGIKTRPIFWKSISVTECRRYGSAKVISSWMIKIIVGIHCLEPIRSPSRKPCSTFLPSVF